MLGFLFGFNARLGRLHYFLSTIGLAVAMTVVIAAMVGVAIQSGAKATDFSADSLQWPVIMLALVFMWVSFTLQSMRFRDIGWDPVCVIPGWIALMLVDMVVATKIPAWALTPEQHGTIVGAVVNFGLFMALLFWPSGDHGAPSSTSGEPSRFPDTPPRSRAAPSPAATRIARVSNGGFGRRAV